MNNEENKKATEEQMKSVLEQKDRNESESNPETDPYIANAKKIQDITGKQGLGNVKLGKDDDGLNADMVLGYFPLDLNSLPSGGIFYPKDIKINIRAARTAEIRHWSTLNERDLFDIEDKLNHIMKECIKVQAPGKMLTWKDILEEDRIVVILSIRDLTFKQGENTLQIAKSCPECSVNNHIEISNKNWQFNKLSDDIYKYYDESTNSLMIQTKSYGNIKMKPPTIGIMSVISEYVQEKRSKGESWDQSYIQLLPYLRDEWRGFKNKDIFDGEVEFKGWDEKKYTLYYRLAEKIKIGVKPDLAVACTECGAEVTAQVDFQQAGGLKKIFVPNISDIAGELL